MKTHFNPTSIRSAVRSLAPAVLLLTLLLAPLPAAATTPLGATIVGSSVQFALFSANATRVEVWIFATPTASTPTATYALTQTDVPNHIWTVTVSGLGAGTLYGYRVWGPTGPTTRAGRRGATSASSRTWTPTATASTPTSCSPTPTPRRSPASPSGSAATTRPPSSAARTPTLSSTAPGRCRSRSWSATPTAGGPTSSPTSR